MRIFLLAGNTGEEDMSLMLECNNSIITVGSYGFWGAYLKPASSFTVYPDLSAYNPNYPYTKKSYKEARLDNFIGLSVSWKNNLLAFL